ncbi:MAG: peptide chain release factor N(5)-glutamine methyltransferase [Cellulosilyticaceae bacterium]
MNLRESITEGTRVLESNGRPDAAIDSKLLLMYVLECDTNWMLLHYQDELEQAKYDMYMGLIAQRATGIPLQHITHCQEFMGLPFDVDERVLVPRQDTETLVETILEYSQHMTIANAIEIGVGSGCISISLAHFLPQLHITGVDLSLDALAVATQNITKHGVANRVTLLESDMFTNYQGEPEGVDLIVSNPPYISTEECKELMTEVITYEPIMALTDGGDGLRFYREITAAATIYLREGGLLAYEIGHLQGRAVCEMMEQAGFKNIRLIQDLARRDRVVVGIK